jgi:hypothetical protein
VSDSVADPEDDSKSENTRGLAHPLRTESSAFSILID